MNKISGNKNFVQRASSFSDSLSRPRLHAYAVSRHCSALHRSMVWTLSGGFDAGGSGLPGAFYAPKVHFIKAQGNALGIGVGVIQPERLIHIARILCHQAHT